MSEVNPVKLTIYGETIDFFYTQLLVQKTDLSLSDVLALGRIQKKLLIPDGIATRLRKAKLIEGRKPHDLITAMIASAVSNKANNGLLA